MYKLMGFTNKSIYYLDKVNSIQTKISAKLRRIGWMEFFTVIYIVYIITYICELNISSSVSCTPNNRHQTLFVLTFK